MLPFVLAAITAAVSLVIGAGMALVMVASFLIEIVGGGDE